MVKVLVTDGRSLASLAAIRSFGEKGFEVHCGDDNKNNLSSFSKYVKKRIVYPSPETSPSEFIDYIIELTKKEQYDIIVPIRDEATLLLSKNQDQISKYTRLYLADYDVLRKFRDKGETIKIAQSVGVPVPATYYPEDTDIEEIKIRVHYPVLIRPRISSGSRGIKNVSSPSEFDEAYYEVKEGYGEPIIQEYISKKGYSTACILLDEGQNEIAAFTYERVKEYPITGGPTVVGISCNDTQIKEYSINLLKSIGWKGVAEVEFILDAEGKPLLLEVNPRFWMPLNLAIKAGVDFPYLIYDLSCGRQPDSVKSYKYGFKYRWVLPNEILWLTQTPHKVRGIKDFLNFWNKNTCYGVLSVKDPMPTVGVLLQSLHYLFNSEKRNMIFKRGW